MLIKCPECGNEISDKSVKCIHCGYPLELSNNMCIISGYQFDLTNILKLINGNEPMAICIREIRELTNLSLFDSKQLYEKINNNKNIPNSFVPKENIVISKTLNTPKCPKCGSTSITAGARGVNFTWGLIGASKTVNRCANCGHTWNP